MNHRKIILYGALGAILAFYAGQWLLDTLLRGPLETRRQTAQGLQKSLEQCKKELSLAREAGKTLDEYRRQSLPQDTEVARSLYQGWLLELVAHVGLADPNVNSNEPASRKGMFSVLAFSVRARGTLEQLTRFLFEFYSAGHLHQIRSLAITPLPKSGELDLTFSIEALSLPTADRKDQLSAERSDRLASPKLADYRPIMDRNLFAVGGGLDPIDQTYLSAVNYVNDEPEVWFTLRATDELVKLRIGDRLDVGQFSGIVVEARGADVILESDGQRWLLTKGDCLTEAYALPPEY
ncbi:MAG: hypothetical protein JW809_06860 [Pirellulales bacterium]|nr:hypothetical protein [Pirellulales bacterium]